MLEASIIQRAARLFGERLPAGWSSRILTAGGRGRWGAVLEIVSPDRKKARLLVEAKNRLFPRDISVLKTRLAVDSAVPSLVITGFLTPATRRRLEEEGLNYLDLTGNMRLVLSRPGLFLETRGADYDPSPSAAPGRSLRGPKAGRVVRALCDLPAPLTISQLAMEAGVNVSYASRLVEWLAREALLNRAPRGPVQTVDRARMIRRWADDYSVLKSNEARSFLDPRGLDHFLRNLANRRSRYAVTGSLAANRLAPLAPARLAMAYVDDPDEAADALALRPAEAGANVILLSPFDTVVFDRTWNDEGVLYVAPSQAAVDLLTSPGRAPAEAEALLESISRNNG